MNKMKAMVVSINSKIDQAEEKKIYKLKGRLLENIQSGSKKKRNED
jgi:hypothetical protein